MRCGARPAGGACSKPPRGSTTSGWSAARCATSCSAASRSSSTSRSRATSRPLARALGGDRRASTSASARRRSQDGGCRFDLARTRTERYAAPGALPDVAPAPIDRDLARRDVSVNAIAVRLPDGGCEAAPSALEDLARGRAARPARRLVRATTRRACGGSRAMRRGWASASSRTPRSSRAPPAPARSAASASATSCGSRCAEPDPCLVFEHVARAQPARAAGGLRAAPAAASTRRSTLLPADGRRDLLVLAACCAGMEAGPAACAGSIISSSTPTDRDVVAAASRWVTGAPLRGASGPAQIARAARGAPLEAVALAGGENARRWIEELRDVRLEIGGDDLIAAGVPEGPGSRRAAPARARRQARGPRERARAGARGGARGLPAGEWRSRGLGAGR